MRDGRKTCADLGTALDVGVTAACKGSRKVIALAAIHTVFPCLADLFFLGDSLFARGCPTMPPRLIDSRSHDDRCHVRLFAPLLVWANRG